MSKLLSSTRERSAKAREILAERLLDWPKLIEAIGEAAGQGFDKVVISPETPVSIKNTEAAAQAIKRLEKEGFLWSWATRRPRPDGPEFIVLEIDWARRNDLPRR